MPVEFKLSWTVDTMNPVSRAFLLENRDQGSFVEQHLAAGAFNLQMQNMYDHFFPGDRSVACNSEDP